MNLFKHKTVLRKERFGVGSYIFREGEYGEHAYRILEGKVEVLVCKESQELSLARLCEGEVFGEMGMISGLPRSASIKAITAVTLEIMTEEDFNESLLFSPDALSPYLSSIFQRTRLLNQHVMDLELKGASYRQENVRNRLNQASGIQSVRLVADSDELKKQTALHDRLIDEFPFFIGRRRETAAVDVFQKNHLAIYDEKPYTISRNHCAIELHDEAIYIRDRGSHAGTIVNNVRINGSGTNIDRVKLDAAENTLILGDAESEIRFKLIVE
ncbi:MAG: Cyclic nucleotide-gated potassium channel [Opitutia bacterium UBA7350]|nr:MAG: Cyclic nucleotide-gated potassium channel [Opitutae bacterium UBA7350]